MFDSKSATEALEIQQHSATDQIFYQQKNVKWNTHNVSIGTMKGRDLNRPFPCLHLAKMNLMKDCPQR